MRMVKSLLFFALVSVALVSCSEDEPTKPAVDELKSTEARIVVEITAAGVTATDKYFIAGSFKAPLDWKENGKELTKRADGKFYIDVTAADFDGGTLAFKIQRNGLWQYVEKDAACAEISDRQLVLADNLGKEFPITVVAFRNTGTCPD